MRISQPATVDTLFSSQSLINFAFLFGLKLARLASSTRGTSNASSNENLELSFSHRHTPENIVASRLAECERHVRNDREKIRQQARGVISERVAAIVCSPISCTPMETIDAVVVKLNTTIDCDACDVQARDNTIGE